jgi:hypothetical protein
MELPSAADATVLQATQGRQPRSQQRQIIAALRIVNAHLL